MLLLIIISSGVLPFYLYHLLTNKRIGIQQLPLKQNFELNDLMVLIVQFLDILHGILQYVLVFQHQLQH